MYLLVKDSFVQQDLCLNAGSNIFVKELRRITHKKSCFSSSSSRTASTPSICEKPTQTHLPGRIRLPRCQTEVLRQGQGVLCGPALGV